MSLQNSNRDLTEGVITLLRNEVSGWSTNSEYNVNNVWGQQVPQSALDEFPRGAVDIIASNDYELSVDFNYRLREATVKITVFGETAGDVENLIDLCDDAISDHWQNYTGDWSYREMDGTAELSEDNGTEDVLRYNRSIDLIFETVKN